MSLSNNDEVRNPAKRFIEWNGDEGYFHFFDKTLVDDQNTKGTKVKIELPFTFVVLDVLAGISGFNEADNVGIYSNEVKEIKKQPLVVKTHKGREIATGLYAIIKNTCVAAGAAFTSCVYIAYYNEQKQLEIGHMKLRGSGLGTWIDFGKRRSFYGCAITVKSMLEGKKGNVTFQMPVFTATQISPQTLGKATSLDKEVQDYLKKYFARNGQELSQAEIVREASESSIPIEAYAEEASRYTQQDAERDQRGETIDPNAPTDDLPF